MEAETAHRDARMRFAGASEFAGLTRDGDCLQDTRYRSPMLEQNRVWLMLNIANSGLTDMLERAVPGRRQSSRRIDQSNHAVGLRKIAPQFARRGVDVLGE